MSIWKSLVPTHMVVSRIRPTNIRHLSLCLGPKDQQPAEHLPKLTVNYVVRGTTTRCCQLSGTIWRRDRWIWVREDREIEVGFLTRTNEFCNSSFAKTHYDLMRYLGNHIFNIIACECQHRRPNHWYWVRYCCIQNELSEESHRPTVVNQRKKL